MGGFGYHSTHPTKWGGGMIVEPCEFCNRPTREAINTTEINNQ